VAMLHNTSKKWVELCKLNSQRRSIYQPVAKLASHIPSKKKKKTNTNQKAGWLADETVIAEIGMQT
jgi:hypothetical protein